jgi:hypothetical protein
LAKYSQQLNFHEFIDKYHLYNVGTIKLRVLKTTRFCCRHSQPFV